MSRRNPKATPEKLRRKTNPEAAWQLDLKNERAHFDQWAKTFDRSAQISSGEAACLHW